MYPFLIGGVPKPGKQSISKIRAAVALQTQRRHSCFVGSSKFQQVIDYIGERGGTRTLDPITKSIVLLDFFQIDSMQAGTNSRGLMCLNVSERQGFVRGKPGDSPFVMVLS
jgi:hypothetical protein